jgi:uncharacterized membrane protein
MYQPPDQYVRQCVSCRRPLFAWLVISAGVGLLISLIFAAPIAEARGHSYVAYTLYQSFGHVCHQIPERSFFIAGHKLAVCARCTGLYLGFAAALSLYPLVRSLRRTDTPQRKWLFIAAAPMAIDVALGFFGIWKNTHFSRLLTGALFGSVVVFYVMPGLAELSLRSSSPLGDTSDGPQDKEVELTSLHEQILTAPSDYSAPHRRI